jgi:hypothetical protein
MIAPPTLSVRVALMALLLTSAFAGSSAAQTQVDSFTRLPEVLKIGSVIYVEDEAGRRTKGRLVDLSGSSLMLESGSGRELRKFAADRLVRVSQVDSLADGFGIGFAMGALPGVRLGLTVHGHCYNESPTESCPGMISASLIGGAILGAIGGGLGALVDSAINGETLVFAKPQVSSVARVRLTPVLSKRGTGLALSVRF